MAKRDLPWRKHPTPYAVWISEVMLQQTQVAVVIPYFKRWMERFPSISALAEASSEEVIKAWEGLGYYSRARQIHAGAKYVAAHCQGILPQQAEELSKIKGLGPYTVGAILSFAFHQKAAAVDGNVVRVLSRLFLIEQEVSKTSTQKQLRQLTLELLPDDEPWVIMEALIELGATVCQKQPKCALCPIQKQCLAFQSGKERQLPVKIARPSITALTRYVSIVMTQGSLLVRRGGEGKVMAGLYEFPYFESQEEQSQFARTLDLKTNLEHKIPSFTHSFTRYRATLHPSMWKAARKIALSGFEWATWKELEELPFSSGHRRILRHIKTEIENAHGHPAH